MKIFLEQSGHSRVMNKSDYKKYILKIKSILIGELLVTFF
jgi:hypothetical protein